MLTSESINTLYKIKLRLVRQIWRGVGLLALLALPASLLRATQTGWLPVHNFHVIAGVFVVTVSLLQKRIPYKINSILLLGLFIAVGSIGLLALGLLGAGVWWLVVSSLLFYILYSMRAGLLSVLATTLFTVVCAYLYVNEIITLPVDANKYVASYSSWVSLLVAITLMPLVVFQAVRIYQESIVVLLSKIEAQRAEIKRVSMHDKLTDLATLTLTEDRFIIASSLAVRNNSKVALLFIDLDGFKEINDTYGHDAGDNVLIEVAKRLKNICRAEDTASRIGGDEFVLLLSGIESIDEACTTAQRVVDALSQPIIDNGEALQIGASVGISLYPDHASELKLLRKKADKAMYGVKKSGKNDWQVYTPPSKQKT